MPSERYANSCTKRSPKAIPSETKNTSFTATFPGQLNKTVTNNYNYNYNGLFSRTIRVSRYQKGKTNLNFTGARDGE